MIRNPRQRLSATLLRLASYRNAFQGQAPLKKLLVRQADLAGAANRSRSKTADLIADFVNLGALSTVYGGLEIFQHTVLEQVLSGTD